MFETEKTIHTEITKSPIDLEGWNEITISATADNKVNMGNYESAERGVFVSKKIRMAAGISLNDEHALLEQEMRRLTNLAETEGARIVAMFCHECDPKAHQDKISIFSKVHKAFLRATKKSFGIEIIDRVKELPAKGEKGVTYVLETTGEVFLWIGAAYESAAKA